MPSIVERDLLVYLKSKVVSSLTIAQTSALRFHIHVRLTVERDALVLVTNRGSPREWASLDTLCNHIRTKYGAGIRLALSLHVERCLRVVSMDYVRHARRNPPTL